MTELAHHEPEKRRKAIFEALFQTRLDMIKPLQQHALQERDESLAVLATQVSLLLARREPDVAIENQIIRAIEAAKIGDRPDLDAQAWKYLSDEFNSTTCIGILGILENFPNEAADDFVQHCQCHPDPKVRIKVSNVASRVKEGRVFARLLAAVSDPDAEVSAAAFKAIKDMAVSELIVRVERALRNEEKWVTETIAAFLPLLVREELRPVLAEARSHTNPMVSARAAAAIKKLDANEAIARQQAASRKIESEFQQAIKVPPPPTPQTASITPPPQASPDIVPTTPKPKPDRIISAKSKMGKTPDQPSPATPPQQPQAIKPVFYKQTEPETAASTTMSAQPRTVHEQLADSQPPKPTPETPPISVEPVKEAPPQQISVPILEKPRPPIEPKPVSESPPRQTPEPAQSMESIEVTKPRTIQDKTSPPSTMQQPTEEKKPSKQPEIEAPVLTLLPGGPAFAVPTGPALKSVIGRYPSFISHPLQQLAETLPGSEHLDAIRESFQGLVAYLNFTFVQAYLFFGQRNERIDKVVEDCLKNDLTGESALRWLHNLSISLKDIRGNDGFFCFPVARAMSLSGDTTPLAMLRELSGYLIDPVEPLEETVPQAVDGYVQILVSLKEILQNKIAMKTPPGAKMPYVDLTGPNPAVLPSESHPGIDIPPGELVVLSKDCSEAMGMLPYFKYLNQKVVYASPGPDQRRTLYDRLELNIEE